MKALLLPLMLASSAALAGGVIRWHAFSIPTDDQAILNLDDQTTLALAFMVRAAGHHCESVFIASYLYFSTPGFKLVCNNGAYHYTLRNPDGNGYVVTVE